MTASQACAAVDDESFAGAYTIGPWRFSTQDGVLSRAGAERRRLEDRAARTLVLLCRHRGEVVSQRDILAKVWDGRVVSANSVSIVIGDIRRALDDDPRGPTHIETLPKRGYRLRPEVVSRAESADPVREGRARRRVIIAGGAAAGLGAVGLGLWRPNTPAPYRIESKPVENDTGRPDLDRLARALGMLVDLQLTKLRGAVLVKGSDIRPNGLLFRSKLILWNDQPTLSLEAVDPATGAIRWAGMASGPASALADNTIAQIEQFARTPARR